MSQQKAIVVETVGGPLIFKEIPIPTVINPHDILIKVVAVALNPVDFKVKNGLKGGEKKGQPFPTPKIIGFDGSGIVHEVGSSASFKVGDEVYWAGDITREGSFQQFQLVDNRLVAKKPTSLTFDEAASLPLTTITAYEAMKELMQVQPNKSILITAGAGGVGSIATQLAHHWGLTVIASVSREETAQWTRSHGADLTVDHKKGIAQSFKDQSLPPVSYCFNTFSDGLLTDIVQVVAPFGRVCGINGNVSDKEVPAIQAMFPKIITYHQEFMFGKAVHKVNEQSVGDLLAEVGQLVDEGKIVHTMHTKFSWKQVEKAFELLESRAVIGKIVMTVDENATAGNGKH